MLSPDNKAAKKRKTGDDAMPVEAPHDPNAQTNTPVNTPVQTVPTEAPSIVPNPVVNVNIEVTIRDDSVVRTIRINAGHDKVDVQCVDAPMECETLTEERFSSVPNQVTPQSSLVQDAGLEEEATLATEVDLDADFVDFDVEMQEDTTLEFKETEVTESREESTGNLESSIVESCEAETPILSQGLALPSLETEFPTLSQGVPHVCPVQKESQQPSPTPVHEKGQQPQPPATHVNEQGQQPPSPPQTLLQSPSLPTITIAPEGVSTFCLKPEGKPGSHTIQRLAKKTQPREDTPTPTHMLKLKKNKMIDQFLSMTECAEEVAEKYLSNNGWDFQRAMNNYLDNAQKLQSGDEEKGQPEAQEEVVA